MAYLSDADLAAVDPWPRIKAAFAGAAPLSSDDDRSEVCKIDGVGFYLVNGDKVKISNDMDLVEGGNDLACDFIPEGEVWVDANQQPHEWAYIAYHEFIERGLMAAGMDYDTAHAQANVAGKSKREAAVESRLTSESPFLSELFAGHLDGQHRAVVPLDGVENLDELADRMAVLFEDPPTGSPWAFRLEPDGVLLAGVESGAPVGSMPVLVFRKVSDPIPFLGFDPRASLTEQIGQIAGGHPPSSVLNPRRNPGRVKRTMGGYRFIINKNKLKPRDRVLHMAQTLAGRRTGRAGLATRIRKAREWHQSPEGMRWHRAQARYQKLQNSVSKVRASLEERSGKRFHLGIGVCGDWQAFRLEEQPVKVRAFESGLDLALGDVWVFAFDADGCAHRLSAAEVIALSEGEAAQTTGLKVTFTFKDTAQRDKAAKMLSDMDVTNEIVQDGLVVVIKRDTQNPVELFGILDRMGGVKGQQSEDVPPEVSLRLIEQATRGGAGLPTGTVDLEESTLHTLLEREFTRLGFDSREEMPCGMVYQERTTGETVVSVCEHLLTEAHVATIRAFLGLPVETPIAVYEDHYDPMRMLRECALSAATAGKTIEQVGPRAWRIDGARVVVYLPEAGIIRIIESDSTDSGIPVDTVYGKKLVSVQRMARDLAREALDNFPKELDYAIEQLRQRAATNTLPAMQQALLLAVDLVQMKRRGQNWPKVESFDRPGKYWMSEANGHAHSVTLDDHGDGESTEQEGHTHKVEGFSIRPAKDGHSHSLLKQVLEDVSDETHRR